MSQSKSDEVAVQIKHRTHGGTVKKPHVGKEYSISYEKKKKRPTDLEKIDGLDYITG